MSAICVGDVGTLIRITVKDKITDVVQDLSTVTDIELKFKKPDGTIITTEGQLLTDGEDGKIYYLVEEGGDLVFDIPGRYRVQARITTSSGEFGTDIQAFKVHPNLD